jgi:hypothetical protein
MRAAERVNTHVQQQGTLAWAFFMQEGGFWDGFSEEDRNRYGYFIDYVLGQAPHAGFIPDTLGLNPIYMQDAADAIDIWRGRHLQNKELIENRTIQLGTGFSFSDYIDYLCVLPFDTLLLLYRSVTKVRTSAIRATSFPLSGLPLETLTEPIRITAHLSTPNCCVNTRRCPPPEGA